MFTISQDLTEDPRLDYMQPMHDNLQYLEINGERLTVGQILDRNKALSYVYRHNNDNNRLLEFLTPIGIPEHPPSQEEQARCRAAFEGYGITKQTYMMMYMQRYSAWYIVATTIINTHAFPSLPSDTLPSN